MNKKIIVYILLLVAVPLTVFIGIYIFNDKMYAWTALAIIIICLFALLLSIEKKQTAVRKIIIISVMIALSVAGRALCAWLPHFKPVTAIVVVTGIYLGKEAGFICGAFTALLSNFMFGQGPWTPFQMFAWGVIGLLAAMFSGSLKKNKFTLILFGALSGILYSLMMDIWTVLWWDSGFNMNRYLAAIISAVPAIIIYIVSNVLFLLLLSKPIGEKLERIIIKYGI